MPLPAPKTYTNRELGLLLSDIKTSFDSFVKTNTEEHQTVMRKQDHTNGDVKKLKLWRAYITGALAVLIFLTSFLLANPVVLSSFLVV